MIQFESVDLSTLNALREDYFEAIKLPQELFLEWIVAKGKCFKIIQRGESIGYVIISEDDRLVEFHLTGSHATKKEAIFSLILNYFGLKSACCKSFDSLLLTCCLTHCKSSKVAGSIFRDYTDTAFCEWDSSLSVRIADGTEIPFLSTFDSELFGSLEELNYLVNNEMLYMFEQGERLVGCGYLIKVLPGKNVYDIGMWTNPDFRRQGYATKIIAYIKNHCLANKYIPICGCAVDNTASRKALERNGFISRHCLVEFDF